MASAAVTFVLATFVLATFVHISNISTVTDLILTKLFGPNFLQAYFLGSNIFLIKILFDSNFFGPKHFLDLNYCDPYFFNAIFVGLNNFHT